MYFALDEAAPAPSPAPNPRHGQHLHKPALRSPPAEHVRRRRLTASPIFVLANTRNSPRGRSAALLARARFENSHGPGAPLGRIAKGTTALPPRANHQWPAEAPAARRLQSWPT